MGQDKANMPHSLNHRLRYWDRHVTYLSLSNVINLLIALYLFCLSTSNVNSSSSKYSMEGEGIGSPTPSQTCGGQIVLRGEVLFYLMFYFLFYRCAHGRLEGLSNLFMSWSPCSYPLYYTTYPSYLSTCLLY